MVWLPGGLTRVRAVTVAPGREGSGAVRDVPEATVGDCEVLVDVERVGLCGTDAEIEHGDCGRAPDAITRRVSLADSARALPHDPTQIKNVVEVAG